MGRSAPRAAVVRASAQSKAMNGRRSMGGMWRGRFDRQSSFALRRAARVRHLLGDMAKKDSHVTWGGRFTAGPAELMLQFSESVSFDRRLAPFDVRGSKAHSAMLAPVGIITSKERDAIHAGLS